MLNGYFVRWSFLTFASKEQKDKVSLRCWNLPFFKKKNHSVGFYKSDAAVGFYKSDAAVGFYFVRILKYYIYCKFCLPCLTFA
jgi:hypothetical protein